VSLSKSFGLPGWVQGLARLVQSWWLVDRIRVSPREGKMLQLPCGTLLKIDEQWYEIDGRTVTSGPFGVQLIYECSGGEQRASLVVTPTASGRTGVVLRVEGHTQELSLDARAIEVFPRARRC